MLFRWLVIAGKNLGTARWHERQHRGGSRDRRFVEPHEFVQQQPHGMRVARNLMGYEQKEMIGIADAQQHRAQHRTRHDIGSAPFLRGDGLGAGFAFGFRQFAQSVIVRLSSRASR